MSTYNIDKYNRIAKVSRKEISQLFAYSFHPLVTAEKIEQWQIDAKNSFFHPTLKNGGKVLIHHVPLDTKYFDMENIYEFDQTSSYLFDGDFDHRQYKCNMCRGHASSTETFYFIDESSYCICKRDKCSAPLLKQMDDLISETFLNVPVVLKSIIQGYIVHERSKYPSIDHLRNIVDIFRVGGRSVQETCIASQEVTLSIKQMVQIKIEEINHHFFDKYYVDVRIDWDHGINVYLGYHNNEWTPSLMYKVMIIEIVKYRKEVRRNLDQKFYHFGEINWTREEDESVTNFLRPLFTRVKKLFDNKTGFEFMKNVQLSPGERYIWFFYQNPKYIRDSSN